LPDSREAIIKRCAIYTRKSSSEGLDRGFNSLDAQRQFCESYIASQAGEGWKALDTRYDDGGFSAVRWTAQPSGVSWQMSRRGRPTW